MSKMELLHLGPTVLDYKRHAFQEGLEIDCKLICADGFEMVSINCWVIRQIFFRILFFEWSS